MELRSSRSRSKTPLIQTTFEKEIDKDLFVGSTYRTTRSITKIIGSNFNEYNTSTPQPSMKTRNSKSEKITRRTRYKTSDYSSEDGEALESSPIENSINHVIDESRRSESRSTGSASAIDFYRAAGDYWNKYPKTDYTYSLYSKDRTEIAPGVLAMPNMSRRSLHGADYSNEFLRSHKETNTNPVEANIAVTPSQSYRTTTEEITRFKQRNLFSNNNYDEKYQYSTYTEHIKKQSFRSKIWNSFITIVTWITAIFYYIFKVQSSTCIWVAKILHRITTRIMLWDSWLLKSVRRRNKVTSLMALCLIPLLFFGGWWLFSQLGPLFYDKYWSNYTITGSHEKILTAGIINSVDENANRKSTASESLSVNNIVLSELTPAQLQEITNSIKLSLNTEDFYNSDKLVNKIIESPNVQNIFNNYKLTNDDHSTQILRQQQKIIDTLKIEIDKIRLELQQLETIYNKHISDAITHLRIEHNHNMANLNYKLNRCCRSAAIPIESHITRILKEFFQAPRELHSYKDISQWLRTTFVAKQDLETHLSNITQNLHSDFDILIKNNGAMIMNDVMSKITNELSRRIDRMQTMQYGDVAIDSVTDEHIKRIVRDSLAIYDADKTGLVDYALESAGGEILTTRCTENYNARTAVLSIFGIPIWHPANTARTVITPGAIPGECWAFQNFPAFLVIKLAARVQIEAFSLEHISKVLSPNGKIDSAPKEFHVYGLQNATDKDPVLLGEYFYDENGPPIQYFTVAVHGLTFHIVELKIISNHGNLKYTCLYRFRVHGKLDIEAS
ncbi:hypothetical protein RI129_009892 [Pyrocoelia pectoralis]|uniref:SUN domain-containing protein n=1 Tax=Pyrocoelia pectoralis TaxID=417401 RepID=A0AAN7ZCP1_9COLE